MLVFQAEATLRLGAETTANQPEGHQPIMTAGALPDESAPAGVRGRWVGLGREANERFTWSANLRHAAGANRSTGPCPCCLVSRTAMRWVAWPTSMHDAPPLLL